MGRSKKKQKKEEAHARAYMGTPHAELGTDPSLWQDETDDLLPDLAGVAAEQAAANKKLLASEMSTAQLQALVAARMAAEASPGGQTMNMAPLVVQAFKTQILLGTESTVLKSVRGRRSVPAIATLMVNKAHRKAKKTARKVVSKACVRNRKPSTSTSIGG